MGEGGNANVDLNVKALGIINEPVSVSAPFSFSPGAPSGHQTITVGPVNLPAIPLPGGIGVDGTIKLANAKNESVTCVPCIESGRRAVVSPRNGVFDSCEVVYAAEGPHEELCFFDG